MRRDFDFSANRLLETLVWRLATARTAAGRRPTPSS